MPKLHDLSRDPSFVFKIMEFALCAVNTLIYSAFFTWHYESTRSTVIALAVAIPNTMITTSVLMLASHFEVQNRVLELALNSSVGALNLVMGVLLLYYIAESSLFFLLVAALCLVVGTLMMVDLVRMVTMLANE